MPTTSTAVASAGRPLASPPSSSNRSVPVRWMSIAASRNIAAETRPWLTEWSTAPVMPRLSTEKMPSTIRPICAIDEYATTPRTSGWRNASSEP